MISGFRRNQWLIAYRGSSIDGVISTDTLVNAYDCLYLTEHLDVVAREFESSQILVLSKVL